MWRTLAGSSVASIDEYVATAVAQGHERIDIGTDSLQVGTRTEFVTVVAVLRPGKGGRAAYRRESVTRIASLRERLAREVWLSVRLGLDLQRELPPEVDLTIHVDANPRPEHRSARYVQELVALVVSQGFRAAIKPTAWAATHAADYVLHALNAAGERKERSRVA